MPLSRKLFLSFAGIIVLILLQFIVLLRGAEDLNTAVARMDQELLPSVVAVQSMNMQLYSARSDLAALTTHTDKVTITEYHSRIKRTLRQMERQAAAYDALLAQRQGRVADATAKLWTNITEQLRLAEKPRLEVVRLASEGDTDGAIALFTRDRADFLRLARYFDQLVTADVAAGRAEAAQAHQDVRRLLRRAARHGRLLGVREPFLYKVADTVIHENESAYPELVQRRDYIVKTIRVEEERFARTIDAGLDQVNSILEKLAAEGKTVFSGEDAFRLYDTFGFPIDLTRELCEERGITVDEESYKTLMEKQRATAREATARNVGDVAWVEDVLKGVKGGEDFVGYESLTAESEILGIVYEGERVEAIGEGDAAQIVLTRTPFYAEMGGQIADQGVILMGNSRFVVSDVQKDKGGKYLHHGKMVTGSIKVDDIVVASIDVERRKAIMRAHSATHLLQKALREVLGEHVHQAGSYQDDQITHFDFTHFSAVSPAELAEVERRVNEKIYEALPVTVKNLPIEEAKKMGAMALFGEKYGSVVRVVDAGGWSTEFCGGTHVTNTAQIGCFKILSESSVAAGIRRIEATTAFGVLDLLDDRTEILAKTAVALKANNLKDAPARAEALAAELKETAKQLEILKAQMAAAKIDGLFENAADIDGVRIVSAYLTGTGADTLRDMVDKVRDKAPNAVTVLIGSDGNKTMMAVGVSKNALARGLKAGALVKKIAAIAGGNGGGKPDFAMAGIRDTSKIDDALNAVPEIVKAEMNQ